MRNILKILAAAVIVNPFILWPVASLAWDHDHHDGDHNDRHDRGHDKNHDWHHKHRSHVNFSFSLWPDTYFYQGPYYPPAQDIYVAPPVYDPVVINGQTYYLSNGRYYVYNGYGYQTVSMPIEQPVMIQPAFEEEEPAPVAYEDSFTINVPNKNGSYTSVTLRKSGKGYIGPQGEYYPEFPKVSQLQVVYGNK